MKCLRTVTLKGSPDNWSTQRTFIPGGTYNTDAAGGNQAHTHGVTDNSHAHTAQVVSFDNRPPYYALAYIMKL